MKWLITGGAGFIGMAAARQLRARGDEVVLVDDLSRALRDGGPGLAVARRNAIVAEGFDFHECNVLDSDFVHVAEDNADADAVLHLAAQAAVTCSERDPLDDARRNVLGTVSVLEAARTVMGGRPLVIFASSNKVYGDLDGYEWPVSEALPTAPRTPYGVSKAAAQWYCRDYARSFGLRTATFVQSCIFGESALESASFDQGWMAHMANAAARSGRVVVCGDGNQVRDVLHVEDLVRAYVAAAECPDLEPGFVCNVGGGRDNAISVNEWVDFLEERLGHPVERQLAPRRTADQRRYVSDLHRISARLGWTPAVGWRDGGARLADAAAARANALDPAELDAVS